MAEPFELTAAEAAQSVRRRELSPVKLVESLLGRIEALEPRLQSWVYLDREAVLSEARKKEAEVESGAGLGHSMAYPLGSKTYTAPPGSRPLPAPKSTPISFLITTLRRSPC